MFTLEELAFYLPDTADNPDRAQLIQDLTFGRIYATIPQDIADAAGLRDSMNTGTSFEFSRIRSTSSSELATSIPSCARPARSRAL